MENTNPIARFEGEHRFLSNFHECEILYDGLMFHSVEAAFQAMKCQSHEERIPLEDMTATQARQAGRRVRLRPDWEECKRELMFALVMQKFSANPVLREKLLATGDVELLEGNHWHDNYWGNCECSGCRNKPGQNHLGKILMEVRRELRAVKNETLCTKLPNGFSLEARNDVETAYPGIHITLVSPEGAREVVCFAEYNPNRPGGRELCVAAYRQDQEDPVYHESYFSNGEEEEPHG